MSIRRRSGPFGPAFGPRFWPPGDGFQNSALPQPTFFNLALNLAYFSSVGQNGHERRDLRSVFAIQ